MSDAKRTGNEGEFGTIASKNIMGLIDEENYKQKYIVDKKHVWIIAKKHPLFRGCFVYSILSYWTHQKHAWPPAADVPPAVQSA